MKYGLGGHGLFSAGSLQASFAISFKLRCYGTVKQLASFSGLFTGCCMLKGQNRKTLR